MYSTPVSGVRENYKESLEQRETTLALIKNILESIDPLVDKLARLLEDNQQANVIANTANGLAKTNLKE